MEILKIILNVIEIVFFGYLFISTLYILIFGIAGLFYVENITQVESKLRKIAVLIPGYKEDMVIVNVAKHALTQSYPKEKYDIFVIADSFAEETLEKLNKLPIDVLIIDIELRNKAKALNWCLSRIDDDYDMVFILDADNEMGVNVLANINAAFDRGFKIVQGHRTAKNMNTNFAILDAISEEINNNIFRKGHRVLGISAALAGSGMGLDFQMFKEIISSLDMGGTCEDKELELRIIKEGGLIEYVSDAHIFDEKTQQSKAFINQRRRWIACQLHYFSNYFLDATKDLISKRNIDYFDKVLQFAIPPRILTLGILLVFTIISCCVYFISSEFYYSWLTIDCYFWLILFLSNLITLIICVPRKFSKVITFGVLISIPYGFILMILSLLKLKGASKKWIHTPHTFNKKNEL